MSRKRSVSSDISTDPKIEQLSEYGTLPLLLYTWAIPHADDWGRITGDPRQFRLTVCPSLSVKAAEVDEALERIAEAGLWERYEVEGRQYIAFPRDSWFTHQTYIAGAKRSNDGSKIPPPPSDDHDEPAPPYKEPHKVPQSAAERQSAVLCVPSPSPSPSPSDGVEVPSRATPAREEPSPLDELDDDERAEVTTLAGILELALSESTRLKRIIHTCRKYPTADPIAIAYDYAIWQETELQDKQGGKKSAKVQRDRVSGWVNQMASKAGWDKYQKPQPQLPEMDGGLDFFVPTPEQIAKAERDFAEQAARFQRPVGQA